MATVNISAMAKTWNDSGTTFTGIGLDVTNTASAAGSMLMNLQVGGSTKFSVDDDGVFAASTATAANPHDLNAGGNGRFGFFQGTSFLLNLGYNSSAAGTLASVFGLFGSTRMVLTPGLEFGWAATTGATNSNDLSLHRDAADTLAQRRGTNAQASRVYGTYTDASNYERLAVTRDAITLESAGTGTANIDLALTPAGTGVLKFGSHTGIGAETVTGYITIKDSGGTSRKVAVVS